MIDIIVRSKRDADAVKAMIQRFYSGWGIRVHTLHGARSLDKAVDRLEDILSRDRFYVILLGREDKELACSLDKKLPFNTVVHVVPRARVRNTRLEHLASEFNYAKARLRLLITWGNDTYLLNNRTGSLLDGYEYNPAYDIFLLIGDRVHNLLRRLGGETCRNPLLQRRFSGVHKIYCGVECIGELHIPDEGFKPTLLVNKKPSVESIDISRIIEYNKDVLEGFEHISLEILRKYRGWVDTVVVPWSGGKDSTLVLYLVLRVYPREKVKAIYVDTGVEFPHTIQFIEEASRKLGIEVHRVYAGIDREIKCGKSLPTHTNRWCTELKIKAIEKAITELASGNTLVVTGDRDVESKTRSNRPPERGEEVKTIAPIKLWSTLHVQLYTLYKKLPQNPLYKYGFYRIGCYICPALRSWEKYIILNRNIYSILIKRQLFKNYIHNIIH